MEDEKRTSDDITPTIHMVNALALDSESDDSDIDSDSTDEEWQIHMEEKTRPVIKIISTKPPFEPPPSREKFQT